MNTHPAYRARLTGGSLLSHTVEIARAVNCVHNTTTLMLVVSRRMFV
jgi:hypothetical protein